MWFVRCFGANVNLGIFHRMMCCRSRRSGSACASIRPAALLEPIAGHRARSARGDRRQPGADPSPGFSDTPLNDTGRREAAELAERIAARGDIRSLWSSDLSRARETAEIVSRGADSATPRLDARLREANRGAWEGHLFIEIEREDPDRIRGVAPRWPAFDFPEVSPLQNSRSA